MLPQNQSERLALTAEEVAKALNILTRHLWNLTAAGKMPAPIRLGRSTRWLAADLAAHLDKLREPAERGE